MNETSVRVSITVFYVHDIEFISRNMYLYLRTASNYRFNNRVQRKGIDILILTLSGYIGTCVTRKELSYTTK